MSTITARPDYWRDHAEPTSVRIPSFVQLARRAIPQILEGVLIPLGLFLITMRFFGIWPAIVAGLGWEAAAISRRLLTGRRVSGIMIVGALMLTTRSVLSLATGSTFVYFAQPILGAALVASAFLLSVVIGQPLARRFASDYCFIPDHVQDDKRVHAFMVRCSMMWAAVGFANTAITLWLLLSQSTTTFIMAKTLLSWVLFLGPVAASVFWFRRSMTRFGLVRAA
ncbi:MAG: VC0807 family protein [Acidimicrobiia bacterium]